MARRYEAGHAAVVGPWLTLACRPPGGHPGPLSTHGESRRRAWTGSSQSHTPRPADNLGGELPRPAFAAGHKRSAGAGRNQAGLVGDGTSWARSRAPSLASSRLT